MNSGVYVLLSALIIRSHSFNLRENLIISELSYATITMTTIIKYKMIIKLTIKMMAMMITLLLKMVVTMAMVSCNFETSGLWYLFEVSDVFPFRMKRFQNRWLCLTQFSEVNIHRIYLEQGRPICMAGCSLNAC